MPERTLAPHLVPTSVTGELPAGLLSAFEDYEAALAANDLGALAGFFLPGSDTLRGDAAGLLVGSDAIAGFRAGRPGVVRRSIRSLHVRAIGTDHALIVSENAPFAGGAGLVTQLWNRTAAGWRIEAAQVAASAPAIDRSIWRVAGTPLVAGEAGGTLEGVRVAVKDLFDVAGFAVGAGNPAYLESATPATASAPSLTALLRAGASVIGIAQTDEFAYSIAGANVHSGTPPNPRVPGGLPGGSSSGPAAAVALGQADLALATDTAGSIRVPASYQGLWGLRTSHGAVSRDGVLPLAPSFDAVGWLARGPELLRTAAAASLDTDRQLPVPARFAVCAMTVFAADEGVQAAFVDAVDRLERSGHLSAVEIISLDPLADLFETFRTVQAAEAWRAHGDWVDAHPGTLGPDVRSRFAFASLIDEDEAAGHRIDLAEARERLDAALDGRILLLPSASSTAPARTASGARIEAIRTATLSLTCLAAIGGYPAVSLPGLSVKGAPLGLSLVGPRHSDLALLDHAAGLAQGLAAGLAADVGTGQAGIVGNTVETLHA
ncbi:AtzH-like domain-containing protein [Cryobacterium sp. GrIS_2_6]|uniref:AtzH-like domain-containing protein n=1 Tax=Cryobacterium sp. GrIS_2_6 TaxID=3162785 RepID=UPI002E0B6DA5|nr:Asp-tRNA(Asn)/Glu-tRNA(Gln) amidotransferase A subunit family amidase [Cryobacterium psychrotolerans]